jgi:hypothetical protein
MYYQFSDHWFASIDESLDKLLVAMETFPNVAVLGDAVGLARIIGMLLPSVPALTRLDDDTRTARPRM